MQNKTAFRQATKRREYMDGWMDAKMTAREDSFFDDVVKYLNIYQRLWQNVLAFVVVVVVVNSLPFP